MDPEIHGDPAGASSIPGQPKLMDLLVGDDADASQVCELLHCLAVKCR